jgi:hypothetical protein
MMLSRRTLVTLQAVGVSVTVLLIAGRDRQGPATVTVTGTALDPASTTPLPHVSVSCKSQHTETDENGQYVIKLPVGVKELCFSAPNRPSVHKLMIVRPAGVPVHLDIFLPDSSHPSRTTLALDRGSSTLSLSDEYGNQDQLLNLNTGSFHAHSPIWLSPKTIAFGSEGMFHDPKGSKRTGVFEFDTDSGRVKQIASEVPAQFLAKCPQKEALAIASQKVLYIMSSISDLASLHPIFRLSPNQGSLLAVDWASNNRIYMTIDDSVPLDNTHFFTRSRIASINADGTDLKPAVSSDTDHSYRYPMTTSNGDLIFCRFTLDGKQQTLWSHSLITGKTMLVAESALRAIHLDRNADRLYYIYRGDLHLRGLKSGADWVIVTSVQNADYLR